MGRFHVLSSALVVLALAGVHVHAARLPQHAASALSLGREDAPVAPADVQPTTQPHHAERSAYGAKSTLYSAFVQWATKHEKPYAGAGDVGDAAGGKLEGSNGPGETLRAEFHKRLAIFESNVAFVMRLVEMKANTTWTLGLDGPFMDRTVAEFEALLGYRPREQAQEVEVAEAVAAEAFPYVDDHAEPMTAIDWREKGVVSEVKNQGVCGSCWSFSTTGVLEGVNALKTGKLLSLSEQELVSCAVEEELKGCNGGEMTQAYGWIKEHGGLVTEQQYEYVSEDGDMPECDLLKLKSSKAQRVTLKSFTQVPVGDEDALRKAIAHHPVSVAVAAQAWQFYQGGVFNGLFGFCGGGLDHGVLAVGYDADPENNYYIIKNSSGTEWGEDGYLRLMMNKGATGPCGITKDASFPIQ